MLKGTRHRIYGAHILPRRAFGKCKLPFYHTVLIYSWSSNLFPQSVGRIDDVIIHSSGEKTVPGPMEAIVLSNLSYVFHLTTQKPQALIDFHLACEEQSSSVESEIRLEF